jgi:hypothetical protein
MMHLSYNQRMDLVASAKMEKTAFSESSLFDPGDEKQYWLSKNPQERLDAIETMREIILQRVFTVAKGPSD